MVKRIARAIDEFVEDLARVLILEATANLVEDTPIDTGWARANWVPSIGESFKETAGTREEAEAGSISLAERGSGILEIASYKLANGKLYITNNVPYITRLNEGHSLQAPAGYVQEAIDRAVEVSIEKAVRRANDRQKVIVFVVGAA